VIDRTGVGREWVRQYDEAHHVHDPDLGRTGCTVRDIM
jgi:hypothetical protein